MLCGKRGSKWCGGYGRRGVVCCGLPTQGDKIEIIELADHRTLSLTLMCLLVNLSSL